jgi:hypothetical protein
MAAKDGQEVADMEDKVDGEWEVGSGKWAVGRKEWSREVRDGIGTASHPGQTRG